MHQVKRQAIVKHNAQEMFILVNSVELYPVFLKWCSSSEVIENKDLFMVAGLTVSLVGIKQDFITKNDFFKQGNDYRINLSLVKGPFEKLTGNWSFTYLTDEASKIELSLDFNFKSGILNSAFKRAFSNIAQQLVSDFVKRANYVYN